MDTIKKRAIRAAVLVREQLAGRNRQEPPIYLPDYAWNEIVKLRRQLELVRRRGWQGAAKRISEDLTDALESFHRQLENTLRVCQSRPAPRSDSTAADIFRDLLALQGEFEQLEIDLEGHTLSVTTDPIRLEDRYFGPFEIRLDWEQLGSPSPYYVVALDPHPAAKNQDVTHPHVQDEQLCEGEGRAAVRAALTEGRLHDFFLLVSQTLHTYGEGSAYVELEHWDGIPCDDCSAPDVSGQAW
jgi:hypothetical protein